MREKDLKAAQLLFQLQVDYNRVIRERDEWKKEAAGLMDTLDKAVSLLREVQVERDYWMSKANEEK